MSHSAVLHHHQLIKHEPRARWIIYFWFISFQAIFLIIKYKQVQKIVIYFVSVWGRATFLEAVNRKGLTSHSNYFPFYVKTLSEELLEELKTGCCTAQVAIAEEKVGLHEWRDVKTWEVLLLCPFLIFQINNYISDQCSRSYWLLNKRFKEWNVWLREWVRGYWHRGRWSLR